MKTKILLITNIVATVIVAAMVVAVVHIKAQYNAPSMCPPGQLPECPWPDPDYSVFFPHPNECEWFFHCSNGVPYCIQCPDGKHWNIERERCEAPEIAGCLVLPPKKKCWDAIQFQQGMSVDACGTPCPMRMDNFGPYHPYAQQMDCP